MSRRLKLKTNISHVFYEMKRNRQNNVKSLTKQIYIPKIWNHHKARVKPYRVKMW